MPEERRLVTVLFADIVGSTALGESTDPEVVRSVLGRYFDRTREIIEAHGGTVEKYIGDAVMAVFGVPRLHDDDAERAVRAAIAMRDAMPGLNVQLTVELQARAGVASGEAVTSTDARGERLVTGDVVNTAARLQQSADVDEVLVGALTERLTREAIEFEPVQPIVVRGKSDAVVAFRAMRARSAVPNQARGLPSMRARLVGRTRELRLLVEVFERTRADRRGHLFTLVGNAGVGKSRLVGEFLARISGRESTHLEAVVADPSPAPAALASAVTATAVRLTVLRGRCLPYGTAITYWPLLEVLHADLGIAFGDPRAVAFERLQLRLSALIPDERLRRPVEDRCAVLLGLVEAVDALPDVIAARLPTELGWGMRRYLEAVAADGALVVLIDDLQWADARVIELLRAVVDRPVDVALLVICVARPELLDIHPTWGSGRANASLIALEPLTGDETRILISRLLDVDELPERLRRRIVERAEGNPLFCEEFVRMLIDEGRLIREEGRWRALPGTADVRVPESIQALLAARLDALAPDEKHVAGVASVIGEHFGVDQLRSLARAMDVDDALDGLDRKGIVVEDRDGGPGALRFRHLLIRDVMYNTIPKVERASAHEAFARALDATPGGLRDERVEILAYHRERAFRLSAEVRLPPTELAVRAAPAFHACLVAAERARDRQDLPAVRVFLGTLHAAADALQALDPVAVDAVDAARVALLVGQERALSGEYLDARVALAEAAERARDAGRPDLAGAANVALATALIFSTADAADLARIDRAIDEAIADFDVAGDASGRIAVQFLALESLFGSGQMREMLAQGERLVEAALAIGDRARAATIYARLTSTAAWMGRGELADAFAAQARALADQLGLVATARLVRFFTARLAWMRGDHATALEIGQQILSESRDARDSQLIISACRILGESLIETGRFDEAEEALRAGTEESIRIGERWSRTELLAYRSLIRTRRGELAAAHELLADAQATLRAEDVAARAVIEEVRGELAAAEGRDDEAEVSFRAAIAAGKATEYWWWAAAAVPLAEFLATRGRRDEAEALLDDLDAVMNATGYRLRAGRLNRVRDALQAQPADAPRRTQARRG